LITLFEVNEAGTIQHTAGSIWLFPRLAYIEASRHVVKLNLYQAG
jgi:hypothetical protein